MVSSLYILFPLFKKRGRNQICYHHHNVAAVETVEDYIETSIRVSPSPPQSILLIPLPILPLWLSTGYEFQSGGGLPYRSALTNNTNGTPLLDIGLNQYYIMHSCSFSSLIPILSIPRRSRTAFQGRITS